MIPSVWFWSVQDSCSTEVVSEGEVLPRCHFPPSFTMSQWVSELDLGWSGGAIASGMFTRREILLAAACQASGKHQECADGATCRYHPLFENIRTFGPSCKH